MLRIIQIVGVFVGLFFLYQSYRMVKSKKEDIPEFFFWNFLGVVIIAVSLFPETIDYLLGILQMKERVYAIFTIGILVSYIILFQLFKYFRNINSNISKLNENLSIMKYEMEKKVHKK